MKSVIKTTLIASTLTLSLANFNTARAGTKPAFYAGASLSQLTVKADGADMTPKTMMLSIDAGLKFNRYLATELRLGTGVKDYTHNWSSTDKSTFTQKSTYGLYVKGILPLSNIFSVYGLVGYTHGSYHYKETDTGFYYSEDSSNGSASYGAGVTVEASKQIDVNLEYAHLYKDTNDGTANFQALTFGVNYQF